MMRRLLLMGLLGLVMGIGWSRLSMPLANAADDRADLTNALQTAPQGIPVKAYFDLAESKLSQAQVVPATNPTTQRTEVVQITNGPHQVGAIWSKPAQYFDLNRDQTLSMWLYFGNGFAKAAEGMAFVLQNDAHQNQAMTQYPDKVNKDIQGETLGVWGVDNHNQEIVSKKLVNQVAATAIQRSWALEFDTHLNTDHKLKGIKAANSFDLINGKPLVGPHLAANYPGEASSYSPHIVLDLLRYFRYVSLNHQGLVQAGKGNYDFLSNAQWHHVTLSYEAGASNSQMGLMTYSFDDRDPITGITSREGAVATCKIDKRKIDPEKTGKALWGFTGATGEKTENNLVVFDQVPGLVTGKSTVTLTNARHQVIKSGGVVHRGEQVALTYQLKYLRGSTNWQNILAQITLPKELTFDTVTIHNANGTTDRVTSADWSAGTPTFKHQLVSALGVDNQWVTLTFSGKVKAEEGIVHPTTSNFTSDQAATPGTTPEFSIGEPLLALKLDTSLDAPIDNTKSINLSGRVMFKGQSYPNSQLRLISKLNGVNQPTQRLSDQDSSGKYRYKLSADVLHSGKNFLTLTVVADDGVSSNPLNVVLVPQETDVEETGKLSFGMLSKQLDFKGRLIGQSQELFRQPGFQLEVVDERPHGTWTLQALADPLVEQTTKQPLSGQLVYKTGGTDFSLSTLEAQVVGSHENTGEGTKVDVAGDWQQKSSDQHPAKGLFLKLASSAMAGDYQGNVTWILNDAI